jgi:hypothetical protein
MSATTSGRSKIMGLTATVAVTLTLVSSGGAQAANGSPVAARTAANPVASACKFKSYGPSTIVLGVKSVRKTFSVKVSGCKLDQFTVGLYPFENENSDTIGFATQSRPTISLDPRALRNSDAGKHANAGVDVFGREDPINKRITPGGAADLSLTLLRASTFGSSFSATPQVKKGKKITIKATLVRANWNGAKRLKAVGFTKARAQLQFEADGSSKFKTVKILTAGTGGRIKTTVKASKSGRWRLAFGGVSSTAPSTSKVKAVKVKR